MVGSPLFHFYPVALCQLLITIPDDMDVPEPLEKKQFCGGLYAAHMITFGNFNEWDVFLEWIMKNDRYEFAGDLQDQDHMCG